MIRLSFIVPCYKVEKYVEHCLDSILACGLLENEYEVICINDASPDSTPNILHQVANQYSQLRIIDLTNNVGLGGGRNLALKEARGKYIWFVDSDDAVVSPNVIALLNQAEQNQLDVLAFNFDRLGEEGQLLSECRAFPNSEVQDGISFVKNVMGEMFYQNIGYVWRFLYRLDYLRDKKLYFPEGVCWEDTVYTPKSMIEASRIMSTSLVGYQYYFHQTSVCRVMEKQYPGKLIFDYVFHAGAELLWYADSLTDNELRERLSIFAKNTYLKNNFLLFLVRTTRLERRNFYDKVYTNRPLVNRVMKEMNGLAQIVLFSKMGPMFADMLSIAYKLKKGLKHG